MTPVLRLIADDLTGALDTAAEFAALCSTVELTRFRGRPRDPA